MINDKNIINKKPTNFKRVLINNQKYIFRAKVAFLLLFVAIYLIFLLNDWTMINNSGFIKKKIYFDKYETNIYFKIKQKLIENQCSDMWNNQREFLNGVIRKFRPKKILEIGVNQGGSSIIILNAIKDISNSKLYSIDLFSDQIIGRCVREYFPELSKKWELFTGNIASEFMEKIGKNIDLVLIDSGHWEPGEILDFLMVLPFLKENAIVIIHDIANQITVSKERNEWSPYIVFNGIRGEKFFPSGNKILTHDIGAIKLEKNQKKYYHDYFRLLGGQWQYFPKEIYINSLNKYFNKYYDKDCLFMFNETVSFNRNFVKNNPKSNFYKINSD